MNEPQLAGVCVAPADMKDKLMFRLGPWLSGGGSWDRVIIGDTPEKHWLWCPPKLVLWDLVLRHSLPLVDFLSPAIVGLYLPAGAGLEPQAVVYDVQQARAAYAMSWRDSSRINARRRSAVLEEGFRTNVLGLYLGPKTPVILRASGK